MADEPTSQAATFNADALASTIRDQVRGALNDVAQQAQQQQSYRQQQAAAAQARQDPIVSQVVEPYVAPGLRAVALQSQAAMDAVTFYNMHPEARRYTPEIEQRFNLLMQQGRPFDRESVYDHWKGQNMDRYLTDRQAEMQQAAAHGATIGAPGIGRPAAQPTLDIERARAMPFEDLDRALDGVTF